MAGGEESGGSCAVLGDRGEDAPATIILHGMRMVANDLGLQQLLALWRKAKGKERDALLWGDEVW